MFRLRRNRISRAKAGPFCKGVRRVCPQKRRCICAAVAMHAAEPISNAQRLSRFRRYERRVQEKRARFDQRPQDIHPLSGCRTEQRPALPWRGREPDGCFPR